MRPLAIVVVMVGVVLLALGTWLILRASLGRDTSTRRPARPAPRPAPRPAADRPQSRVAFPPAAVARTASRPEADDAPWQRPEVAPSPVSEGSGAADEEPTPGVDPEPAAAEVTAPLADEPRTDAPGTDEAAAPTAPGPDEAGTDEAADEPITVHQPGIAGEAVGAGEALDDRDNAAAEGVRESVDGDERAPDQAERRSLAPRRPPRRSLARGLLAWRCRVRLRSRARRHRPPSSSRRTCRPARLPGGPRSTRRRRTPTRPADETSTADEEPAPGPPADAGDTTDRGGCRRRRGRPTELPRTRRPGSTPA